MNKPTFPIIDAHSHLPFDVAAIQKILEEMRLSIVNITVDLSDCSNVSRQRGWYRELRQNHPDRFAWCTSFSIEGFTEPEWLPRVLEQLEQDFDNGACGCKVWKNIGMDIRDPATGKYIDIDNKRFTPIFEFVEQARKPMLMHIGEPLACWQPLSDESPHTGYYQQNPQWHLYNKPQSPQHSKLMATRDTILERHPHLTVIGAHYGSHEYDFNEVAHRFDRFPNFYVDTSARLHDGLLQASRNYEATRNFFLRYADRILWGVDWVLDKPASQQAKDPAALIADYRSRCGEEWDFFASNDVVTCGRQSSKALALPENALRAIFHDNAKRIYALPM